MRNTITRLPLRIVGIAAVVAAALSVIGAPAGAQTSITPSDFYNGKYSDCFWSIGVINGTRANIAYPDAGANYWGAAYTLPSGSKLELKGTYPHSRYFSANAYNSLGQVTDALADFQLNPDKGSSNPFRPGVKRTVKKRSFTMSLLDETPAAAVKPDPRSNEPARNTLYTKPSGDVSGIHYLVWRVYIEDKGRDLRGGVPLPRPTLTLADGTKLTGQKACDAMTSQEKRLPDPSALLVPKGQYDAIRYKAGVPDYFPATQDPVWRVQYNRAYLLALWSGETIANPPKGGTGGFFPNLHNQYMRAALNRKLGKVAAIRGVMPTTPKTYRGDKTLAKTQLRYRSFCMNESVLTTKVMDCVYDEEVPLNKKRRYVVVTSRKEDKPSNATAKCGVAWVEWKPTGDGGTDYDFGWMQIRDMLPAPNFHNSIQDTKTPGDEKATLGKYMPTGTYYADKAAFEKLGCPAK